MDCKYSTTTASGTFTVYNQMLHKCTATKFCKEKGHILAPITTLEDKEALTKLLHPDCDIHKGVRHYHIGLDITPCGETQDRVFSNGVIYDKNVHGHLYDDFNTPKTTCPLAYIHYLYYTNRLVIGAKNGCRQQPMKVICLDQSTATAQPIVKNDDYLKLSQTQTLVAVGGVFFVVGCLVLAVAKLYRQNKVLKKELNTPSENYLLNTEASN